MPHFMPHDEEDFIAAQLAQNGIPEHDALGLAKAGHIGVQGFGVEL